MRIQKQLSIFVENRPGVISRALAMLFDASVNIQGMSVLDTVDHLVVRLLVDNPTKALLLLEEEEYQVLEQDVVVVEVSNRPGAMMDLGRKLARADININYAYGTASPDQQKAMLVIHTDSIERTLEAVREIE